MKHFFQLFIILLLVLIAPTCILAAVHSEEGEHYPFDTWYSIGPADPYLQFAYTQNEDRDGWDYTMGEYYKNDQTFAAVKFYSIGASETYLASNATQFSGSYLFKSGFFVGLNYINLNSEDDTTYISPGYRLSFGEKSYIALSADYLSSADIHRVNGYDLDWRFYFEKLQLTGEFYSPKEGDSMTTVGLAFQIADPFVIGVDIQNQQDNNEASVGFTYTLDSMILDAKYGRDTAEENYFQISDMVKVNDNFGIGVSYYKYNPAEDPQIGVLCKYTTDTYKVKFGYFPSNDTYDRTWVLSFFMNIK